MWVSDNRSGRTWLEFGKQVGSFAVGAAVALLGVYYFLGYALPDVRDELGRVRADVQALRNDLRKAEERHRSDLSSHIAKEETARERLSKSIGVLQTNIIALRQKVENRKLTPEEMQAILATVKEVSNTEAQWFVSHKPQSGSGIPEIPRNITAANLRGVLQFDVPVDVGSLYSYKVQNFALSQYLALMLLAKDAKWHATNKGLSVEYLGGSAFFAARANVTPEELQRQADLFNSLSRTVNETIGKGEVTQPAAPQKPFAMPPDPPFRPAPHFPQPRAPDLPVR